MGFIDVLKEKLGMRAKKMEELKVPSISIKVETAINGLRKQIKEAEGIIDVRRQYLQREINNIVSPIPHVCTNAYLIADGVHSYCLPSINKEENIFFVYGEKGSIIPIHEHIQYERVYVLSGKIKEIVEQGIYRLGSCGSDTLFFPPHTRHGFEFLEDSVLIVVFKPPLEIIQEIA